MVALVREGAWSVLRASCVEIAADALLLRFLVAVVGFFALPLVTPSKASTSGLAGSVFVELRAERRRDMLLNCLYTVIEISRNAGCLN